MAKREILYPYDERGNLMHYAVDRPYGYDYYTPNDWRPGAEFEATLELDHTISGRSAKYFMWHDINTGLTYPMFAADLVDLCKKGIVRRGISHSVWVPRKRGANFGIRWAKAL
jgi:hypothetical protein